MCIPYLDPGDDERGQHDEVLGQGDRRLVREEEDHLEMGVLYATVI